MANTTTGFVLSPLRYVLFEFGSPAEAVEVDEAVPKHKELDELGAEFDTCPKFTRSLLSICCLDSANPEVCGMAIVIEEGSVAPESGFTFSSFMLWRRPDINICCGAPGTIEIFIGIAGKLVPERENELGELPLRRWPVTLLTVCC